MKIRRVQRTRNCVLSFLFAALPLASSHALSAGVVPSQPCLFSFVPNQLAGNAWYKPGTPPQVINGHLDDSFGRKELWPQLRANLRRTHGSFSLFAAEIGHLSSTKGLLPLLKAEHIPVSVEMPGFTQCLDGTLIGKAEIEGEAVNGTNNLFATVFGIMKPVDRTDPNGKGWFVTRDNKAFVPDEILFDERIPNLLPEFDPEVLARTQGTWEQRKQAARKENGCAVSRQPYRQLLGALMQDYVKFLRVAKAHWGDRMPAISLHWNVNPGWEWRDEAGLDAIYTNDPHYFDVPANFWSIVAKHPQYNSVPALNDLIDLLTAAGFKPKTVYMDVDWTYDIPYVTEVLRLHKAALHARRVQLGINVVEASLGDQDELTFDGTTLKRRTVPIVSPNVLYENTLIAILQYLKSSGIYAADMQIRVGSWSHRPYEIGAQIEENMPGSLAHTANAIATLLTESPRRSAKQRSSLKKEKAHAVSN
jgi:hypothetical protein